MSQIVMNGGGNNPFKKLTNAGGESYRSVGGCGGSGTFVFVYWSNYGRQPGGGTDTMKQNVREEDG